MRLLRAGTDNGARVLLDERDGIAVATVDGREFATLSALLDACGGDRSRIAPGRVLDNAGQQLLEPVGNPPKVICIGLNYRMHAEESEAPIPAHPMVFAKWRTALTHPGADIPLPSESEFVDWEAELAIVIGRRCRRVPAQDADAVVFGYTAANDVSMRDFQAHTEQFTAGKTWDRATPLGPAVVSADALGGAHPDLAIGGRLNGEAVQASRTSDLIFGVGPLIEYLSTVMTLEPGDVVLTGTPSGVGVAAEPPRSLAAGDVFEVEIEGIGRLENRFVAEMV